MGYDITEEDWDQLEREMDEEDRLIEEAKSPEQKAEEAAVRERERIHYEKCKVARQFLRQIHAKDAAYLKKQREQREQREQRN